MMSGDVCKEWASDGEMSRKRKNENDGVSMAKKPASARITQKREWKKLA